MANMLDKTDRAHCVLSHPSQGDRVVSKIARYDWMTDSKPGTFRLVSKHDLNIDDEYQRNSVSSTKVLAIAKSWDWTLLGVLLVVEREDGSLWVFDGGHRARAAFLRDDIFTLPCMVYQVSGIAEEAKAFLGHALMVSTIGAIDKFKAALCARDQLTARVAALLSELGLRVTKCAKHKTDVKCINTIMSMVKTDEALAKRVIEFVLAATDDSPIDSDVLSGIMFCCENFKPTCDFLLEYGPKLATFTMAEMKRAINQQKAEIGKGGERVMAIGILSLVNKHRSPRGRITLR